MHFVWFSMRDGFLTTPGPRLRIPPRKRLGWDSETCEKNPPHMKTIHSQTHKNTQQMQGLP